VSTNLDKWVSTKATAHLDHVTLR